MKKLFGYFRSLFYLLPEVLRTIMRKPDTTLFPLTQSKYHDAYRGRVRMREENCVGCGLCVRDCPAGALELEKRSKTSYTLRHYAERCAYCAQCEYSCKFNAIYLDNSYRSAVENKEKLHETLVNKE